MQIYSQLTHGKFSETFSWINEVENLHLFPWEETFIDSGSSCTQSNLQGLGSSREKDLMVFVRHLESLWVRWAAMLMRLIDKFGQESAKEVQSGGQTEMFLRKLKKAMTKPFCVVSKKMPAHFHRVARNWIWVKGLEVLLSSIGVPQRMYEVQVFTSLRV